MDNNLRHLSTAKASIRTLLATHGKAGTLNLVAEVLRESLPTRKGRPTRAQSLTRAILKALDSIIPLVSEEEERIEEIVEILIEREGE